MMFILLLLLVSVIFGLCWYLGGSVVIDVVFMYGGFVRIML